MDKYAINSELKLLRNFIPPVNKFILPFANIFISMMKKGFDKDKVKVEYFKVGNIKCHIVTPLELVNKKTPCLFYIHGGGFIFKAMFNHYKSEQQYALRSKCRVIGIDYDLSPKYTFPHALNQCIDVYKYILDQSELLKLEVFNVIIGGDSAGGLLALDTYLSVKRLKVIKPNGLMLIYPVVDNSNNYKSKKLYVDTPCWNQKLNKKMWDYYLKDNKYISPIKRVDEINVDNVYIELCEFDCLHDEGKALYELLSEKVDNIILNDTKGTFHGYDINTKAEVTIDSFNKRVKFLKDVMYKKI